MAILDEISSRFFTLVLFFLFSSFPLIHSLSTVSISQVGNQTLVCALVQNASLESDQSSSYLNCTSFPHEIQIPVNPSFGSIVEIVGGNGFLCALSSPSSSNSFMVCWRFSINGTNQSYKRIYSGFRVEELDSGNSHICGLVEGNSTKFLECWQWRNFNPTGNSLIASSVAVGENFVCGLSESGQLQCFGGYTNVTEHVPRGNYSVVAAGSRHVCAISAGANVECWGDVVGEQPSGEFTALALGEDRSCFLRPDGTVLCWGVNNFSLPDSLQETVFLSLDAKGDVFCGLTVANYSLYCWGKDGRFSLNSAVFEDVVPGPCRKKCPCDPLPGYGRYCSEGTMICQSCISQTSPLPPLPPSPSPSPSPSPVSTSPETTTNGGSSRWNSKMVAFMVVGCFGSVSLILVICFLIVRHCKSNKRMSSRVHDSGPMDDPALAPRQPVATLEKKLSHLISMGSPLEEYSLETLLAATNSFSDEHKIGTGSFGTVYLGKLPDGSEIAVKRADTSSSAQESHAARFIQRCQEDKDYAFVNELEFLSRLNHKNLVRLLGYCEDSNERVLVYEYMDNGTLFDHLHKMENSPVRSWAARIKVALDAARGIQYLHEFAVPPIIHRDIKSSNILLDSTWTAKVSDFGLSLMGPLDDESHLSLKAAGTVGYIDPEYYRLQRLTTKSDVYSFGVVLLELLSGCKAIHMNENGVPRNVVDLVVPYIVKDDVHRVLDQRVHPPTPIEIEAVAYVGYLAADCVTLESPERPTMTEVVNRLERALAACLAPPNVSRSTSTTSSEYLQ